MTGQFFLARTTNTPAKRYSSLFTLERVLSAFMAIFLLLNFGAQEAFADSKPDKKGRMEKARKAFVQARNLCEKGEHRRCIEKYKESLQWIRRAGGETKREALIQFNMAQAYRMLELYSEALSHYREYLKTLPDAPNREAVETIIEELEAKVKKQPDPVPPAKPDPVPTAKPDPVPTVEPDLGRPVKPDPVPTVEPDLGRPVKPDPVPTVEPHPVTPQLRPRDPDTRPTEEPPTAESPQVPVVTSDLEVEYTPRNRGWLGVGIASGILAIIAEGGAFALWSRYEGGDTTSNKWHGVAYYACHGVAALTAALAITGIVMFIKSGGKEVPLRESGKNTNEDKEPDQSSLSWSPLFSPSSNGVMFGVQGSWRYGRN